MADFDPFFLDPRQVAHAFNRAAAAYSANAAFQDEIAARLDERLELVRLAPPRILEVGAGCGNGVSLLSRRYPQAEIYALDLAVEMLCAGRRHFENHGRLSHICADAEKLPIADRSVDLIFSNLTLQWCNDLEAVFREFNRVLRIEGLLMFTTLGPDTLKELRASWAQVNDGIHVNAFVDMHDVGDAMIRAGFSGPVLDMEEVTLTYADVPALMRELKALGAHNVAVGRAHGLSSRRCLQQMISAYERYRRSDGRLPATQEVIYGHGWAPSGGTRPQDGSTVATFPLSQLHRRVT
ncbi:MAG TPA: malonyl-ACP O-methyltransferase BioC [Gammaproteobacteria bacterium]|nr:malonyl-ACP O-methyltransferase BioC [Gammaproteobacteria bacterium]